MKTMIGPEIRVGSIPDRLTKRSLLSRDAEAKQGYHELAEMARCLSDWANYESQGKVPDAYTVSSLFCRCEVCRKF